jgi:hypothetical protein
LWLLDLVLAPLWDEFFLKVARVGYRGR